MKISSLDVEQQSPLYSRGERKSKRKYTLVQFLKCSQTTSCHDCPNPMENLTLICFMVMASFILRLPSSWVNTPSPGGVFCGVSWLPKDPSTGSLPLLSLVSPVCCAHSLFLQYPFSPGFKKTSTVPVLLLTQYKTTQHKQYEKGNKLFEIPFSSQIRSPSLKERTLIQIQEKQDCYGTDPSIH